MQNRYSSVTTMPKNTQDIVRWWWSSWWQLSSFNQSIVCHSQI